MNSITKKPSILILAPFVGVSTRGAETFVIEWVNALKDRYDITVFSYTKHPALIDSHVEVVPRSTLPKFVDAYKSFTNKLTSFLSRKQSPLLQVLKVPIKFLLRILDRTIYFSSGAIEQYFFSKYVFSKVSNGYDVIFPTNGIWGVSFAKDYTKKHSGIVLYTGHGGIGIEEKAIINKDIDAYIATTPTTYKWSKQFSDKVSYIPIGISLERFENSIIEKSEYSQLARPIILCVGAFTPFKRQKLLIDAMSHTTGSLILIGDGELKSELQEYCETKLPGRYFITHQPYKEMPYFYSLSDVFSLPSDNEPFGIVYLEAMAANKPIVAPDDGSRHAIIGDAGIYCDVTNAKIYAKAIEEAVQKEWNNVPKDHVKKHFSWDSISEQYHQIISRLVKSDI
jgi:glycosyltransferase involved in cell wall biosynthesis